MLFASVAAGSRAGSVAVVWRPGRRRENIVPEAAREKYAPDEPGPARPHPRARLSMHRTIVMG